MAHLVAVGGWSEWVQVMEGKDIRSSSATDQKETPMSVNPDPSTMPMPVPPDIPDVGPSPDVPTGPPDVGPSPDEPEPMTDELTAKGFARRVPGT